jgi:hypothetical protein
LEFDYGDGTTGTVASHTYTTDVYKEYPVTVTATDTVNNCSVTSGVSIIKVTPGGTCTGYMPGDYDEDGVIDIFDALGVAMYEVGLVTITDDCLLKALDVDGSGGNPGINDALAIARYDVGLVCSCSLDSLR